MASDSFFPAAVTQQLFPEVETAATVALFGTGECKIIEKLLSEKNGRPVIRCLVRQKDVPAKREEGVRQLWLHRLLTHSRYPRERLTVEYPITACRPSAR